MSSRCLFTVDTLSRDAQLTGSTLAEGVGFEPTVGCPTHAFQACRFGRSRTPPGSRSGYKPDTMVDDAAVGPCATTPGEPSQGRKAAALSRARRVPQIVWPPCHSPL